jgi:hypothetical protein
MSGVVALRAAQVPPPRERERDALDADIEAQLRELEAACPGTRCVIIADTPTGALVDIFSAYENYPSLRVTFLHSALRERRRPRRP